MPSKKLSWHAVKQAMYKGVNLYRVLAIYAALKPDRVALVIDQQQISYRQLKDRADQLSAYLQRQSAIQQYSRIGLLLDHHIDSTASLFALTRLGMDVVILNPYLERSKMQQLITREKLWVIGRGLILNSFSIRQAIELPENSVNDTVLPIDIYRLVRISICSSGSTGVPKLVTRDAAPWQAFSLLILLLQRFKFYRAKTVFIMTPIYHGAGLTGFILAFCLGKPLILQTRFQVEQALGLIQQYQVDFMSLVPTILQRLLQHQPQLTSVRTIVSGSAQLSATVSQKCLHDYPHIRLLNMYGSSETGINFIADSQNLRQHPQSIGQAIRGVEYQILNDVQQAVSVGEVGLLWTKCAWSKTPQQWLNCGDLAHEDAHGYLYLQGRQDDMLICGGVNVYPVELEQIILQHPAIYAAYAYAVDDQDLGQCLALHLVLQQMVTIEMLQHWLSERVPRYLRPKHIEIVDEIKTDSIGKPIYHGST